MHHLPFHNNYCVTGPAKINHMSTCIACDTKKNTDFFISALSNTPEFYCYCIVQWT